MRISIRSIVLGCCAVLLYASASADEKSQVEAKPKPLVMTADQIRAAVAASQQRNLGYPVPAEVDPTNKSERMLLLLPDGSVIVETILTIDGQPFQAHREQMITDGLKEADVDGDGKATWVEAIAKPGFLGGRFAYLGQNEQVRDRTIAQFDQNKDGLVDRVELRTLFAQYTGGPAFLVQGGYGQPNPPVREILDVNKDEILQAEELAAAEARLISRDANDNEIVDLAELTGNPGVGYNVANTRLAAMQQRQVLLVHLHSQADWKNVFDLLTVRYGKDGKLTAESFPRTPDLVKRLDGNDNGLLDKDEVSAISILEPQLVYEVNLGDSGQLASGGTLQVKSPALAGSPLAAGATTTLELKGIRVQFAVSNPKPNFGNLDLYATQILNNYDKDKNGYIEKEELGTQPQLAQQFVAWDLNSDGKVYADEVKKSYEKQQVPTWQRVTVATADLGNSLFSLLDADNSGRLSLREIKSAAARLKTADKNGDGQLSSDEIPGTIRFTVSRGGGYGGQFVQVGGGRGGVGAAGAKPAGPDWFVRMDKNGDGDITPREFLGDAEQFKSLDTNGDGFIELKEAEAAK